MNQHDSYDELHLSSAAAAHDAAASGPGRPRHERLVAQGLCLAAVLLVVVPVVWRVGPAEWARWKHAAAESAYERGDVQAAVTWLSEALQRAPGDEAMLLRRAEWWHELGEESKALEDLERAGAAVTGVYRLGMLMERAELYQKMQRWKAGVRDWKEIEKLSSESPNLLPRSLVLNGLAYARALAKMELEEAYLDVQESIRLAASSANLDTRGYILYLRGNPVAAEEDLNEAIKSMRKDVAEWEKKYAELREQYIDLRPLKQQDAAMRRGLAVMLYHRALVCELLKPEQAERDYAAIRKQMKREPGPWLF